MFRFSTISKVVDRISLSLFHIAKWGLFFMMALVTVDVILRYLFKRPTGVADEISGYLLILIVFLGAAHTLKAGRHVSVDMAVKRLPPRIRYWLDLVTSILGILAVAMILWRAVIIVYTSYSRGQLWPSALQTPMYIPQLLLPVGLFVLMLQCIMTCGRQEISNLK